MNKKYLIIIAAALMMWLAPLVKAFSLEENINIDAKGGCKVALVMNIQDNCLGIYKAAMRFINGDNSAGLLDEDAVREYFALFPELKLESYHIFRRKDGTMVQIILSADDAAAALNTGALGALELSKSRNVIGDTELTMTMPRLQHEVPPILRKRANSLSTFIGGITFIVRLATPTELLQTSGTKNDFNRCTWKLSLDEILDSNYPDLKARW